MGDGAAGPPFDVEATRAFLVERGDAARDDGRPGDAAALYEEALRLGPASSALEAACGVAFAAAGDFGRAERHLRAAVALAPDDASPRLHLARCYRAWGRLDEAERCLDAIDAQAPDAGLTADERAALERSGWRPRRTPAAVDGGPHGERQVVRRALARHVDATDPDIVSEVLPEPPEAALVAHREGIEVRLPYRRVPTRWGDTLLLRGVTALRGVCLCPEPMAEVIVRLDGHTIARELPRGPYPLANERDQPRLAKYVFNVWLDLSSFAPGRYRLEIMLGDLRGAARSWGEDVLVAPPLDGDAGAASDGWIPPGDGALADRIIGLPAAVRSGRRQLVRADIGSILVQRLDQLGDLALSVPAIRRLAALFPAARLTGLMSPANAPLARSLGVFDAVIEAPFPHEAGQRQRSMTADAQRALAATLAEHRFDLAIDLSENAASRPLLVLSGAPFLVGFGGSRCPWLATEMQGWSHDAVNGHETASHAAKQRGLVEWLGAIGGDPHAVERRTDLPRAGLAALGLDPAAPFVVLHTGARLPFTRWPHYPALADALLARTALRVVVLGEVAAPLPRTDRVVHRPELLPFDDLDTLLHHCALFVGNDSGPKHLAALRGVPVVSVHMARNNWNEWGQDGGGLVVSKRVPCAGCLIQSDPEECGRDLACLTGITVEDVLGAALRHV